MSVSKYTPYETYFPVHALPKQWCIYIYIHVYSLSYFFLYHTQNPFYIIQGMRYSEVHVIEWTLHKFSTIQILNSLVSYVLPSPVTLPSPSSVAPPV